MSVAFIVGFNALSDIEVQNVLAAEDSRYKRIFERNHLTHSAQRVKKTILDLNYPSCMDSSLLQKDDFNSRVSFVRQNWFNGRYAFWISKIENLISELNELSPQYLLDQHNITPRIVFIFHSSTLSRMPPPPIAALLALMAMSVVNVTGIWRIVIMSCNAGQEQKQHFRPGEGAWWSQRFMEDISRLWCLAAIPKPYLPLDCTFEENWIKNLIPEIISQKINQNKIDYEIKGYSSYITTDSMGRRARADSIPGIAPSHILQETLLCRRRATDFKRVVYPDGTKQKVVNWKTISTAKDLFDSDDEILL